MNRESEKHEQVLTDTIKQLEDEDYRVIRLDGKSPSIVAINDECSVAISVLGKSRRQKRTKTITYLEDHYDMFDKIDRVHFDIKKEKREKVIARVVNDYKDNGFSVVVLNGKSPDAIAYKNKGIFAIEIIGLKEGYSPDYYIRGKEAAYDMFDGLMIKTFTYDTDNVFTQTFGRKRNNDYI